MSKNLRFSLLLFAHVFILLVLKAQDRPNIMVIIADDMGVDAMSAYGIGTNQPNTPFLDSLIGEGILFENAWGYPTCSPSRAAMLTGRYAHKNGTLDGNSLRLSEETLFEYIDSITGSAYADAAFGKWHLSANIDAEIHPNNQGADTFVGSLNSGVDDYFNWERVQNGVTDQANVYVTTYLTDQAINWIDNQNQPWFVWMAHNAPHEPIHIPPDSLYTHSNTNGRLNKYMCMIESVDHEAARLYNSLTQAEKDNTLVIFVGDNGTPNVLLQAYPANHGKGTLYEGGIRVPMLLSGFGVNRVNEREDAMVSLLDIFGTIGELLGDNLAGGYHNSFSLFPLLSDANAPVRKYNYTEYGSTTYNDYRTIRNQQYKLIFNEDGSRELYDLGIDPLETVNLMLSPLTPELNTLIVELEAEAEIRATLWSCDDKIKNGIETGIDVGGLCNGCFATDFISGNILSGDYRTKTLIASDGVVPSPENVEYRSKDICLEAGFDVQAGAEFLAEIDPCITGIDDVDCPNSSSTSTTNIGCNTNPTELSIYNETVNNEVRTVVTNTYPNHIYRLRNNAVLDPVNQTYSIDATPQLATTNTPVVQNTGRPGGLFGVALNGVALAPAPAEPFIFENTATGEYNWNWVFEPTMNQGQGQGKVNLDCASAHKSNARGYHYHGNMFEYAEVLYPGISTTTIPTEPIQMGWAADGFPVLYRYGPDGAGGLTLLTPSYQLKAGLRPGDGVSVPCGSYNGKYTNDYEYMPGLGDLDECNGIERDVMLETVEGSVTFSYFYVITDDFPQISRCLSGEPDPSFD